MVASQNDFPPKDRIGKEEQNGFVAIDIREKDASFKTRNIYTRTIFKRRIWRSYKKRKQEKLFASLTDSVTTFRLLQRRMSYFFQLLKSNPCWLYAFYSKRALNSTVTQVITSFLESKEFEVQISTVATLTMSLSTIQVFVVRAWLNRVHGSSWEFSRAFFPCSGALWGCAYFIFAEPHFSRDISFAERCHLASCHLDTKQTSQLRKGGVGLKDWQREQLSLRQLKRQIYEMVFCGLVAALQKKLRITTHFRLLACVPNRLVTTYM